MTRRWVSYGSKVYFGTPDTYEDDGSPAWGGFDIANCPRPTANAAHIVRCVNAYDKLKAKIIQLESKLKELE
jgi:hypothetical protein